MNDRRTFVKPNKAESGANHVTQEGTEGSQGRADPGTPTDIVALVSMSLRRERARAAVSLTELARRAGIAKSTLSQLENGTGNPSLETLWALGTALGVPLSRLIDPPRSDIRVIRADEGVVMHAERDPYEAAMLASCPPGARRDIYRVGAAPGTAHLARPHTAGTVEHLILGSGRVLAGPEGEAVELGPGDYLRYPGDVPHIFHALEPDTVGIIVMEHV
ncbi:XRE family transcriptional regulator [Trebonia kvetii]|uniref:XRE family transcriptional regulator n=1 Tax=Trebonia kvetii TaxID=2480626 RepID=A0A6P2BUP8_9ACTN|nr:XRE family transcriptional regulator [Trebonia kvetii]